MLQEETVLIELHLVYTSSALVVLLVLLVGYAICRRGDTHAPHESATNLLIHANKPATVI